MQLLTRHSQLPQQRQTLTDLQQQLQNPMCQHTKSCWQHPCLVTAAAGLPGRGGSLCIMLRLLTQLRLLKRLPWPQLLLHSLLRLTCFLGWTHPGRQPLLQPPHQVL